MIRSYQHENVFLRGDNKIVFASKVNMYALHLLHGK